MRLLFTIPVILLGMQFAARADMIPPGTEIAVRTDRPINVNEWDRGRIYPGFVARDVIARDGDVAIPSGAHVELMVRQVGPGQMALDLESISVDGRRYVVDNAPGPEFDTNTNNYSAGGLVGTILVALGGNSDVETNGREIRVPAGAMVRFQLREPLHVVCWQDPGYMHDGYHYHHDRDSY